MFDPAKDSKIFLQEKGNNFAINNFYRLINAYMLWM